MNIIDQHSQSPDLNHIENLWSVMKNMVQKQNPKNLDELTMIILEVWEELDQELIMNLCVSFLVRGNKYFALSGQRLTY